MLLDAIAAKTLAALMVLSMINAEGLKPHLPLHVEDDGDSWLVKSTPFTDAHRGLQFCMFYVFIRKDSAEVIGMDFAGRQILSEERKAYWKKLMTPEQYAGIFGPLRHFERNGIRDIILAAYGGVINKPADAVDYAYVLMQTKPALAAIGKNALKAVEADTDHDKVWHVTQHRADGADTEILSFSRKTGKLLSGNL